MSQNKLTSGYFWARMYVQWWIAKYFETLRIVFDAIKFLKVLEVVEVMEFIGNPWKFKKSEMHLRDHDLQNLGDCKTFETLSRLARFPGILRYRTLFESEFRRSQKIWVQSMSCDRSWIRVQPLVCEHRNGDLRTLPVYSFTVLDEP